MLKNLLVVVSLLVLGGMIGGLWGSKNYSSTSAVTGLTDFKNKNVSEVTMVVTGMVMSVSGKSMEIENEGDKMTIRAADQVYVSLPSSSEPTVTPEAEREGIVGRHAPSAITPVSDFSQVQAGRKILAQMKRQPNGEFLVFSVGYID